MRLQRDFSEVTSRRSEAFASVWSRKQMSLSCDDIDQLIDDDVFVEVDAEQVPAARVVSTRLLHCHLHRKTIQCCVFEYLAFCGIFIE